MCRLTAAGTRHSYIVSTSLGERGRRSRRPTVALVATVAAMAGLAAGARALACGEGAVVASAAAQPGSVWYVPRAPKLRVDVAVGCPTSIGAYQDVVNTFPGPPLVAASPSRGLICRYSPRASTSRPGELVRQVRLTRAQAQALSAAVRSLDLKAPAGLWTGAAHCPADFGTVALIGFSYATHRDIGLWYEASGCQTLDNGRIGASETGNPSFYDRFLSTVNRLAPPVT